MHLRCIVFSVFVLLVIQCERAASYKSEVEITPAPPEEATTKKQGWFSKLFRGSSETTTTTTTTPLPPRSAPTASKPPPLVIPQNAGGSVGPAPLMPLGPRPDTPSSSPWGSSSSGGDRQQPPQWPQPTATTPTTPPQRGSTPPMHQQHGAAGPLHFPTPTVRPNAGQPNLPPGFQPYPTKPQPSGVDLSYGGGGRPQTGGGGFPAGRPGFAAMTSSTTTTTTTPRSAKPAMDIDLRGSMGNDPMTPTTSRKPTTAKEDFPALPAPRRPSIKEDFPALPGPKTPPASPTPASVLPSSPTGPRPSSPSAWGPTPKPGNGPPQFVPQQPTASSSSTPPPNRVSFVPKAGSSTTVRPGSQQSGSNLKASDDELRELTEILYTKEVNSQLNLVRINPQGKTRSIDSADEAPQPLLEVDPKAFENPTIAKMRLLFNNYEMDTQVNEHVSANEHKEENDFVDAVMATSVMRQAMLFLQNKGIVTPDPKTHRDLIKELWFTQYSRGSGKVGSSGFEHVFVNEVKNGTIIGLHNWVYFYDEEKAGRIDYKGYMNQADMGTKGKIMKIRFSHNGVNKPVNTLFIGTSPELELALYTVCLKMRPDSTCPVSLGNNRFGVVTYSWRYRGKNLIGSAYPEI